MTVEATKSALAASLLFANALLISAPNPRQIVIWFVLRLIILSSPINAPEPTNKILVVSTCTVSFFNFLVFFPGTLITSNSSF